MRRLTLLPFLFPTMLAAQDVDTTLAGRVQSLEDLVRMLRQQVGDLAEAGLVPREGYRVELGGMVLVNGYHNIAKVNHPDVPMFTLPPDPPGGLPAEALGASVRQTRLTLFALAPMVLGAALTGELDVDFFGGEPTPGGRYPMLRIRRLRADLVWQHAAVMVGQEDPLISELNPSSVAAIAIPGFSGSGNLWLWIPQVRVGASAGNTVRGGVDVAILATTGASAQDERAERSGRPFLQGRLFARWGDPESPSEISAGGHVGWLATTGDSLLTSKALAASAHLVITRYLEIRGEAFTGQALGVLGGGGIGRSLGIGDVPVRTVGGWGQVALHPVPVLEVGGGAGVDDPDDADLDPASARLENRTFSGYVTWRPHPLVLGVEFRRTGTTYGPAVGQVWNSHVNVALGFVF